MVLFVVRHGVECGAINSLTSAGDTFNMTWTKDKKTTRTEKTKGSKNGRLKRLGISVDELNDQENTCSASKHQATNEIGQGRQYTLEESGIYIYLVR